MYKKILLLAGSSILLGGCTLTQGGAAISVASPTPTPTSSPVASLAPSTPASDPELDKITPESGSDEIQSIEKDIDNSKILNEDFSDLNK